VGFLFLGQDFSQRDGEIVLAARVLEKFWGSSMLARSRVEKIDVRGRSHDYFDEDACHASGDR
jgi:hypothetical protein